MARVVGAPALVLPVALEAHFHAAAGVAGSDEVVLRTRRLVQRRAAGVVAVHDELPLHAVYDGTKLLFPIIEKWRTLKLYTEEYYAGVDSGIYEYEPVKAVMYPARARYLKQGIEQVFARKAAAKKNGQKALASACKIVANSSYGWPGLRTRDRTGIEYGPEGDWVKQAMPGEAPKTIMKMKGFSKSNGCLTDKSEDAMKFEQGMSDAQIKAATHDLGVADYDRMLGNEHLAPDTEVGWKGHPGVYYVRCYSEEDRS